MSVWSPCKISEPYENPFWEFSKGVVLCGYIPVPCVIFQFCVVIFWFHVVIFWFRVVIFRFRVVIFQTKWEENSGLPKFTPLSHALWSDQLIFISDISHERYMKILLALMGVLALRSAHTSLSPHFAQPPINTKRWNMQTTYWGAIKKKSDHFQTT